MVKRQAILSFLMHWFAKNLYACLWTHQTDFNIDFKALITMKYMKVTDSDV